MIINKRKFIVYICGVLLWMGIIFSFSAQPSEASDETSLGFGRVIAEILVEGFEELSEEAQFKLVEGWNIFIRKTAHFCEYAVLGILCAFALSQVKISGRKAAAIGIVICAGYAASDELHQYFVPGRAGRITDVCLDSAGAITGIVLVMLIRYFRMKKKKVGSL